MVNFGGAINLKISQVGHSSLKQIVEMSRFREGKKGFRVVDIYLAAVAMGIAIGKREKVTDIIHSGWGIQLGSIDPDGLFQLVLEDLHNDIQDDVAELKRAFEEHAEAGLKHFSEVVHSEVDLLEVMIPKTSKKSRKEQLTGTLRRTIDELLEE